jgi:ssDNA-binding Zn-finger/Zn-ribbon topoisomerase 1
MRFFAKGKRGPWFGCKRYPECRETLDADNATDPDLPA